MESDKVHLWVLRKVESLKQQYFEIDPSLEEIAEVIKKGPYIDLCLGFNTIGKPKEIDYFDTYGIPVLFYSYGPGHDRERNIEGVKNALEEARKYGRDIGESDVLIREISLSGALHINGLDVLVKNLQLGGFKMNPKAFVQAQLLLRRKGNLYK